MRAPLGSIALVLAAAAAMACAKDALMQGESFQPDGTLPTDPPSDRVDASAGSCEGGKGCDASAADSASVLPAADGATPPSNTCQTARAVGTLSGDTGSQTITAKGSCSEWISFRATEDSSSAIGAPMKVTLTLTSTGHDFDLYVYYTPSKDVVACSTPFAQSETRGTVDEIVPITWGEASVANGSDDGRTIGVAVQSAMGGCPPGSGWTLTADGNR
ncbi:MAG: hypothetical protein JWP87_5240 [Labilithrix sp.]|nr:hypothetical protein [Labilithrix sp.]